jgi:aspartyl aminopeptidase
MCMKSFTVLRDMGCCSTANPIFAAGYGIRIVDCGLPQLSMHSVREMCGAEDINTAFRHFRAFFREFTSIDEQLKVDM